MSARPASLTTITWTIPGQPAAEASFGPTEGGDDAWAAFEAALAAGWIVRIDGVSAPAALRAVLDRSARARDCYTKIKPDQAIAGSYLVWWALDPATSSHR